MRGLTPILKEVLWVMLSNSIACCREIIYERKTQSVWQTSLLSYFKKFPQPPNLQQPPPWSVSSREHQGNAVHQQKDYDLLEAQKMVSIFSNKVLFN